MARTYSAEGIIIKRVNVGEADRLVTILSKYQGKFTAIAKGVRKVASRRSPNLELFNYVKAHFATGKNLDVITEVESLATFKNIKENLFKLSFSFHLAEMVNEFLAEGQGGKEVFELLLGVLRDLQEEDPKKVKVILHAFDIKFFDLVGYKPQLHTCVKCGRNVGRDRNFLSAELGGIVDQNCYRGSFFAKPVSQDAIKLLRFLQSEDWPQIKRLSVDDSLNKEVELLLRFYIEYLIEKELKSTNFIDQIRK
jgi:DNA repair protein RecO (recombination protein O)